MVGASYSLAFELYPYKKVAAQDQPRHRHPVLVVGGGPVGLAVALDLGRKGTPVLVVDDHDGVGQGSRAICFAKRTLEIADRLGAADPMVEKGVVWSVGKVFHSLRHEHGEAAWHENHRFDNDELPVVVVCGTRTRIGGTRSMIHRVLTKRSRRNRLFVRAQISPAARKKL